MAQPLELYSLKIVLILQVNIQCLTNKIGSYFNTIQQKYVL